MTDRPTAPVGATPAGPAAAPGAGDGGGGGGARRQLLTLALGIGAVVLASAFGGTGLVGRILEPPFPLGVPLAAAAAILGAVVVLRAIARAGGARDDAREMIRAVRLIFVAVGCFAAAAGWLIGSAVPIVAGLIIVGIDVVETTFLLLVTASRGTEGDAPPAPPAG